MSSTTDGQIRYVKFGDIVEANGRTIRQNNLDIPHNIPLDALVYLKMDKWHGEGSGCSSKTEARMRVVVHARDCDGSPLYGLAMCTLEEYLRVRAMYRDDFVARCLVDQITGYVHGYPESSLTPIRVTPEILDGRDALCWPEDQ